MSKVIDRLKEYLESKGMSPSKAETKIGVSNGTLSKPFNKGTTIKTDTLEKFLSVFNDLNPVWLFSDNPKTISMKFNEVPTPLNVVREGDENYKVFKLRTDTNIDQQMIPYYDIEATAGLVELFSDKMKAMDPLDYVHVPNFPKCDGAVSITGDSMYPLLKSGDIVMYKKVTDIKNDIFWGQMYLISISVDDEEYIMVKYIQKSEKGDNYIKLVSQNRHHQDKDVKIEKVRALALIKGSIRINSMN